MTQKTLVIHSGTFKTGSSAIQLYLNRADYFGVLGAVSARYPQSGKSTSIQHVNLVAELRGERVFMPSKGGWDALLAEIHEHDAATTVVSSEWFSVLEAKHMQRIGDLCRAAGVKVRWVHYVREQPGLYNAFYVERVVTMRPDFRDVIDLPFEEFGTWSPVDLGFMRYASFAERLLEAIPDVDLEIRPFNREYLLDGDAVRDFCDVVGLPFEPEHSETTNVGTGWRTVETARRLVPFIDRAGLPRKVRRASNPAAARQRWLQLIRSELVTVTTEVGWNSDSAIYMTPEHRATILGEYHDENARLDALMDTPWLDIVESSRMKPHNVGSYHDVSGEELMTVMSRVLAVVYEMPDQVKALVKAEPESTPDEPPTRSLARRAASAARRRLSG